MDMVSTRHPPPPPPHISPSYHPPILSIGMICVFLALGLLMIVVLFFVWFMLHKKRRMATIHTDEEVSQLEHEVQRRQPLIPKTDYVLPFSEIVTSTNNFDKDLIIGSGGFGNVYHGKLSDGREVAVKRLNESSRQGIDEFRTEIETLFKYRHGNIVSLIGYCEHDSELILVYEFVQRGTLTNHLYHSTSSKLPPALSWHQRLNVCIEAARGLNYLHTGYVTPLIHRDVKSTNILLDRDFHAKVGDFGLSRKGPTQSQSHVETKVVGTIGYLDPEYFQTEKLTVKSDVYSFGIVLLEIICAKPAIVGHPSNRLNLKEWAINKELKDMIDIRLDTWNINPDSLIMVMDTAKKCVADRSVDRPIMMEVLKDLEKALFLQESRFRRDRTEELATPSSYTRERTEELATPSSYTRERNEELATPSSYTRDITEELATPSSYTSASADFSISPLATTSSYTRDRTEELATPSYTRDRTQELSTPSSYTSASADFSISPLANSNDDLEHVGQEATGEKSNVDLVHHAIPSTCATPSAKSNQGQGSDSACQGGWNWPWKWW